MTDLADFPEEEKNKFVPVVSILIGIPKNWETYYDKRLMQLNRLISELFSYKYGILSLFFRPRHLQKFHLIGSMLESQKLPKNLSVRRSSW